MGGIGFVSSLCCPGSSKSNPVDRSEFGGGMSFLLARGFILIVIPKVLPHFAFVKFRPCPNVEKFEK